MDPRHNYVALSCVNVGIGGGGSTNMVAHLAIVDFFGNVLLDTYVTPTSRVTDYRTATTGITEAHLRSGAMSFKTVQFRVSNLLKGKIVVGHSLWLDFSVLGITHPARDTRDVALYQPFRNALRTPNHAPGLSTLMWQFMQRRACEGVQDPVEICRAALDLWRSSRQEWENAIATMNWPSALPPAKFSQYFT